VNLLIQTLLHISNTTQKVKGPKRKWWVRIIDISHWYYYALHIPCA